MIQSRYSLGALLYLLSFGCTSNNQTVTDREPSLPNILYILADDLGYGDIASFNPDSKIETPELNKLAKDGMKFTDAHSPSAVCTPTRYGILTGRYCWRSRLPVGVLRGYGRALIEPDRLTVASLLQSQGYRTGVVGKWHLGLDWVLKEGAAIGQTDQSTTANSVGMVTDLDSELLDFSKKPTDGPLDHGFDYSYILPASLDMDPYCYLENDELVTLPSDSTAGNDLNTGYTGAFWRAGRIAPDFEFDQVLPNFIDKAIQFIRETERRGSPFFLYLPLAAPHTPWMPTNPYSNISQAGNYGDFVSMVDAEIGRVLRSLVELGLEENTLVIFTSDNGPFWPPNMIESYEHRSAGSLRGMKADAWEGGHRIPFIAKWPGKIKPESESKALTSLTNLMATCAEVVGLDLPAEAGEDSHSILPILMGDSNAVANQKAIIQHSSKGVFVVRRGDWKLILGRGSGGFSQPTTYQPKVGEPAGQLYDLSIDLQETTNLYNEQPDVVAELSGILEEFRKTGRSN